MVWDKKAFLNRLGYLKKASAAHLQTREEKTDCLTPRQARKLFALPDLETPPLTGPSSVYSSKNTRSVDSIWRTSGAVLLTGRKRRILCLGTRL